MWWHTQGSGGTGLLGLEQFRQESYKTQLCQPRLCKNGQGESLRGPFKGGLVHLKDVI